MGIVRLLMSIDDPSPEILQAVEGAVEWFVQAELTGIRVVKEQDERAPDGLNRVVVVDAQVPPLWARFYEIESNQPIFADRDGVSKSTLADIGYERRNGYSWYGKWPRRLLETEYPDWKQRVNVRTLVEQISDVRPSGSALLRNYPNPFNSNTTIEYKIDINESVQLQIYDALGKKIRTLIDEKQRPGHYSVQWDGRTDGGVTVGSGVYMYRLVAGSYQKTLRLILIR